MDTFKAAISTVSPVAEFCIEASPDDYSDRTGFLIIGSLMLVPHSQGFIDNGDLISTVSIELPPAFPRRHEPSRATGD